MFRLLWHSWIFGGSRLPSGIKCGRREQTPRQWSCSKEEKPGLREPKNERNFIKENWYAGTEEKNHKEGQPRNRKSNDSNGQQTREDDISLRPSGTCQYSQRSTFNVQRLIVEQFSMFHGSAGLLRTVGYLACEWFDMSVEWWTVREKMPRCPKQD